MSNFQAGRYHRDRLIAPLRLFCPVSSELYVEDIDLDQLLASGKKLLLLDLDNTLTHWKSEEFDPKVVAWIEKAQAMGFQLALISNSIKGHRSHRVGDRFGMAVFRGRFKPSKQSYLRALKHFGLPPEQAVMIGDQLITDVFGANRTQIEAIWIHRRGEREWQGTAVNRWLEKRILPFIARAFAPLGELEEVSTVAVAEPGKATVGQQLARFAVVGGLAWSITTGLSIFFKNLQVGDFNLLHSLGSWMVLHVPKVLQWSNSEADEAIPVLFWVAALIAMFFNFWANRSWTFGVKAKETRMKHMRRFYLVSIIGTIFNTILASWFVHLMGGGSHGHDRITVLAQGFSAVIVAFWNFGSQRLYAFKDH